MTKAFKYSAAFILLFAIMLSASGCIIIPRHMYYDDFEVGDVESVQVYDLRYAESTYRSYFLENEEPVYTIPKNHTESFFNDLAEIRFTDYIIIVLAAIDPSFHYGYWTVRINFTDGGYMLISDGSYGETFNAEGECIDSNHYGCETEEWETLIFTYLPRELTLPKETEGVSDTTEIK